MVPFALPVSELKHLTNIVKHLPKNKANDCRDIYILHQNNHYYMVACNGHCAGLYRYPGEWGGQQIVWRVKLEDALNLISIKAKVPSIMVTPDEERGAKLEYLGFSCTAEVEEDFYLRRPVDAMLSLARRGKLIPSKATHCVSAGQFAHVFPSKDAFCIILQEAGKPEGMQFCTCPDWPNFLAVVMPMKCQREEIGRAIKQSRAFFTD